MGSEIYKSARTLLAFAYRLTMEVRKMTRQDEMRRKFLEQTDNALADWQADGTNLPAAPLAFLRTVSERDVNHPDYSKVPTNNRRAMNGRERGRKRELLRKLRNGLRDLARFPSFVAPYPKLRPWVTKADMREVYDIENLVEVLNRALEVHGEDLAQELLGKLNRFYESLPRDHRGRKGFSPYGGGRKHVELVERFGF